MFLCLFVLCTKISKENKVQFQFFNIFLFPPTDDDDDDDILLKKTN